MAARDRVVINIKVDVDDGELDKLIIRIATLERRFQALQKRISKMATSSRQMNENLRNTNKTLRTTNDQVDKVGKKFDDAAKKIDATHKKLQESNKGLQDYADTTKKLNKQMDDHDRRNKRMRRSFGKFDQILKRVVMQIGKFIMTLAKLSFIAVAGQLALFTAGLLAVKLALITGRAAVQIYQIALKGLSVTAAGVATALSVAAAAMREYNEAMLAPSMGGGLQGYQKASRLSRAVGSQNAGLLGGESTTAVVAALAKAGVSTGRVSPIARQLINLTGGDPAAVAAVAKTLGGKDFNAASSAVKGAAGFRADSLEGVTTMSQLLNAIQSGSVVSGAYANQSDMLAGTFIGTAKTQFAGLKDLFADMGQPLLGPFRDTMLDISQILRSNFIALGAIINKFGAESFAPTLTTMIEKTMDFVRMNIFDHLEDIEQMGENFVGFFRSVRNFFGDMANFLGQFEPAANVVIDMFGAMRGTGGGRSLFRQFSDLVVKNAEGFKNFGASIGSVLGALFDALGSGQSGFFAKLPLFSDILDKVASDLIPGLAATMEGIMPILEALPDLISQIGDLFKYTIAPAFKTLTTILGFILGMPGGGILGLAGLAFMKAPGRKGMMKNAMGLGGGQPRFFSERMAKINERRALKGQDPLNSGHALRGLVGLSLGLGGANQAYQEGSMAGTGTFTAAAGGAMIGSIAGPLGAAIGAAIGAGVGMIAGAFGSAAQTRRRAENVRKAAERLRSIDTGMMTSAELNALQGQYSLANSLILSSRVADATLGLFSSVSNASVGGTVLDRFAEENPEMRNITLGRLLEIQGVSADFSSSELGITVGAYRSAVEGFKQQRLDLISALAEANGMTVKEYSNDRFGTELDMDSTIMDFDSVTDKLSEELDEVVDTFERTQDAIANLTVNVAALADEFGVTSDKVLELAENLGYRLQTGVTDFQRLVLQAFLQPIDRTQTFLPDMAKTPIGYAEQNATARAAFTTLRDGLIAGDVTADMYSDAIEAFATLFVLGGGSPDVGGLAGISELYEFYGKDPQNAAGISFFDVINPNLEAATTDILERMSAQYNIPIEVLKGALYTNGQGVGFDNFGISNLSYTVLAEEQKRRQAFTGGVSVRNPLERLSLLENQLSDFDYANVSDQILTLLGEDTGTARGAINRSELTDSELGAIINTAVVQASLIPAKEAREIENNEFLRKVAGVTDDSGMKIGGVSINNIGRVIGKIIREETEREP